MAAKKGAIKRDGKGKFAKGNKGGPGRPPLSAEAKVIEGIKAAVTAEKVATILDLIYEDAVNGSHKARELYLAYAAGKPRQVVEMSGPDGKPIEMIDHAREKLAQQLASIAARLAEAGDVGKPNGSGSGGSTL